LIQKIIGRKSRLNSRGYCINSKERWNKKIKLEYRRKKKIFVKAWIQKALRKFKRANQKKIK
jgi:hypothetical protein